MFVISIHVSDTRVGVTVGVGVRVDVGVSVCVWEGDIPADEDVGVIISVGV